MIMLSERKTSSEEPFFFYLEPNLNSHCFLSKPREGMDEFLTPGLKKKIVDNLTPVFINIPNA